MRCPLPSACWTAVVGPADRDGALSFAMVPVAREIASGVDFHAPRIGS